MILMVLRKALFPLKRSQSGVPADFHAVHTSGLLKVTPESVNNATVSYTWRSPGLLFGDPVDNPERLRHPRMRAEREGGCPGRLYRGRSRGVSVRNLPFVRGRTLRTLMRRMLTMHPSPRTNEVGRPGITPPASGRASRRRSGSGREPAAAPALPLPSNGIPQPSSAIRRPSRSWRPGSLRRTGFPPRWTS